MELLRPLVLEEISLFKFNTFQNESRSLGEFGFRKIGLDSKKYERHITS